MSQAAAIPLFVASLAVTLAGARLFARRLDRLGVRLGFSETLVGLLTAIAADGPEISSALYALARGAHGVGVGVLVGSNAFNLAAMIGASALLAGRVRLSGCALVLEGASCAAVTALGCALLAGGLAPLPAALGLFAVVAPYLAIVRALGRRERPTPPRPDHKPPTPLHERPTPPRTEAPAHHLLAAAVLDVALIIAGSAGMVQSALALGSHWRISDALLGTLVLGPLTSLPNAATAIRLGLARRGEALVTEAFNSNTINFALGAIIPALVVAPAAADATGDAELAWLGAMTAATIALLARRRGLGRASALALVAAYGGFVALAIIRI